MWRKTFSPIRFLIIVSFFSALVSVSVSAGNDHSPEVEHKALQQRMDFDNTHILGQCIQSGTVYLMHRKKSEIKKMLEVRKDYREEIIEDFELEKSAIAETETNKRKQ